MQKKLFQMHFPSLPLGWNFAEETFVNYKFDQINLYHHNKRHSDKDDDEEMKATSTFQLLWVEIEQWETYAVDLLKVGCILRGVNCI